MRHAIIGCGLALVAGCASPTSAPTNENETVNVNDSLPGGTERTRKPITAGTFVFYNTENLYDTINDPRTDDDDLTPRGEMRWSGERYHRKLEQLAIALSWTDPAMPLLIGLCEVENAQVVRDLSRTGALLEADYEVVHRDSPDERGADVALLVKRGWANVLAVESLEVPLERDRTRDVLYVRLGLAESDQLHVFVNHWPSRREGEELSAPKRMSAALTVRGRVDKLLARDPDARIVIMGDLNDTPSDPSVREGLRAALDVNDAGADLYDLVAMDRGEYRGSVARDGRWSYFDHMIVSRGMLRPKAGRWKALSAASLKDDRMIFRHPRFGEQPDRTFSSGGQHHPRGFSDHLPVVLVLGE